MQAAVLAPAAVFEIGLRALGWFALGAAAAALAVTEYPGCPVESAAGAVVAVAVAATAAMTPVH